MKDITFNSRETCLAYRSAWKTQYKSLSVEIRTLRLADRFRQRKEFAHITLTESEERCLAAAAKLSVPALFSCNRLSRSKLATEMLSELKEAKLEAQRQYLARKAAETGLPPTEPGSTLPA